MNHDPLQTIFGLSDEALIEHVTAAAQQQQDEEYFPFWWRKFCLFNADTGERGGEAYVWQRPDITCNTI